MFIPQNKVREIESYGNFDADSDLLRSSEPIVFRGLAKDWGLTRSGQKSADSAMRYLSAFYNQNPVLAFEAPAEAKGRFFYNADLTGFNFARRKVDLNAVFRVLSGLKGQDHANSLYVGATDVDQFLPGFRKENDLDIKSLDPSVNIWMGNRTRVAPHFDFPDNLACCVVGKRRFTLFPPDQLENLYVGPIDITPAGQPISLVDLHDPDLEKFPKFQTAMNASLVAELDPGDVLFVPSMWWHQVEGLTDFNVLVNYWWCDSPLFMGAPLTVLRHAVLGLRNLSKEKRAAWLKQFEYYIFEHDAHSLDHIPDNALGILGELDKHKASQLKMFLINMLKG